MHSVRNMISSLDFDIRPGSGLGIFEIGTSLWTVLDMLRGQSRKHMFPQVEVKYDPDSPTTPVILHLRPHLDLLFSGRHQRLHTISLRRLRDPHPPALLTYKNTLLSSSQEVLRRVGVSRAFGPTYPGDDLRYPGVWFSFDEDGRSDSRKGTSPHPEDRMQEVRRVVICQKGLNNEDRDALAEVLECPIMYGDIQRAVVKVHDGVTLYFYPSTAEPLRIRIGISTAQDLACDLGPPLKVHYKDDDRMNIHAQQVIDEETDSSYFYNYFQHGIDFLISGSTHTVKKIILHTNVPGTALFQQYKRCPWEIEGLPEDDEDETPPRKAFYERVEDISHFLSPGDTPPSMLLDRTDEEEGLTLPSSSTRLLGYDGIVLETTESAQVVSVMLF